ncbi:helicase [Petralouisia muris]|uniref:Helicase n=1 Tax=Petralouisia muris TaxID=3032872 RepID=A0AC61RYW1_9FIRM|nr:DEAD/DEAH box helicase [Petralouisia muris]TGY97214.1 helicase [Petralouisia muris]
MDRKIPEEDTRKRNGKILSTGSSASKGIAPGRSSSYGLTRLIRQYKEKERLAFQQAELKGAIDLVPLLSVSYGQLQVEFKIGGKRKYVLKNIMTFANAMRRGDLVSYGKELEFYHLPEAFTERGRALAEFLVMVADNRIRNRQTLSYYHKDDNRYVHIHSGNMDEFFQAVGTEEFQTETNFNSWQMYHISDEPYQPLLSVRGQEDGAVLEQEEMFYTFGNRYGYLWKDCVIYRMPMEQVREIRPFWEYMSEYKYRECFVSQGELPAFCRELLPVLKRHYQIKRYGFQENQYLPPEPEYEIYLDAPDKQTVTCEMYVRYEELKYNILDKPRIIENRDELAELKQRERVRVWFQNMDFQKKQMVLAGDDEKLYALLTEGMEELGRVGNIFVSDALKSIQVTPSPAVSVGVSLKGELLELTLESEDMPLSELIEILSSYQRKRKFFRLKNGDFLSMEEDGLAVLSKIQEGIMVPASQWSQGSITLPKYRALYLDGELKDQNRFHAAKDRKFKALVRNMKTVEDNDFEVPKSLEKVLREYQKQGFLWLKTLHVNGFGGILADDMGLGKTLQVIAFLLSEQEKLQEDAVLSEKFALIICPASLVYNWKNEIEKFAPGMHAMTVTGTAPERKEIIDSAGKLDILITSYDLLRRDEEFYEGYSFCHEIIDEAQYIKNHNTRAAKAVKNIRAGFKAALTGTPIENRLSELWSIFDYLMPGFLYIYSRFRDEIEIPAVTEQDDEKRGHLRKMIRPFVLRRLKKDVLKDLPAKLEEAVFARMEEEQEKLYTAHVQRIKLMLEGQTEAEFASGKIQILAELTRLRQLCCDPSLVYQNYQGESAKLLMCMDLMKNAIDGGHRILLFSQFTSMFSILQERMQKKNIPFLTLTGATPKERRAELVDSFQQGEVPVFCISLKAGGTGLNLTAADIVIHYDPWWNVAVQNQATDRAHRIGQKNSVTVYKLIAKDTIEEKILRLQEKKSELAEQLLGHEGFEGVKFTKEEMLELLG